MPRAIRPAAAALAATLALAACTGDGAAKKKADPVTLRVGLLYTTGGQGGDLASAVLGSAGLAVEAAAKNNVTIAITEADYAGDVANAGRAVADLAPDVDAIVVGTDDGDIVPALSGVTIPVLHPLISLNAAVTSDARTFRFAPANKLEARRIVTFLTGHRTYTKIAIIADDTGFGAEGLADLRAAFADAGVSPVSVQTFTPGGDVHTPLAAAAQRGAQAAVFWVESPGEAARLVVDAQKSNFAYQIVLSGNLATPAFAKNASSQVAPVAYRDGMLSVGVWAGPWFPIRRTVEFFREFRTVNSAIPPLRATSVYDSILALARAASTDGTGAEQLVSGLESLRDFEGAGAPVTFGPGKHDGIDLDDLAMLGFTKTQSAPGGEFAPDVETGGGFFSVVHESLDLPPKYAYLKNVS